jgi:hypothetical protein
MMAQKTLTLILLRSDRELWDGGSARLQVTDVNRSTLKILHDQKLAQGSQIIQMNLDLLFDAGQSYGISVDAPKHRSAWQLINRRTFLREEDGTQTEGKESFMRLMLVPNKPSSSNLDDGYDRLLERGSPVVAASTGITRQAFQELKPEAKMALLNIEAKLRETKLNGISLVSFVEAVRLVDVDRLFLFMRSELKDAVENSPHFASAPGHGAPINTPVVLPPHPDSWKHRRFGAGNVQLSFSKTAEPLPGNADKQVFSVDVDLDLAKGIGHVVEFLDNHFSKKKTDQTLIYALLFSQGITPDYTLDPIEV